MSNAIHTILNKCAAFGRYLIPQNCVLCGAHSGDSRLCESCFADLPGLPEHCPRCASPSPDGLQCGSCLSAPPDFDATHACWCYAFPTTHLVHLLKFRANLGLAGFFGEALAARFPHNRFDIIVPMPLHARRLRERGFNQSMEIARHVARATGIPLADRAVARVRATAAQSDLPVARRARNVRNAFCCSADLRGLRVAVIDDVMTTGSTLAELARVIRRAGAAQVENWIVARTLRDY